MKYAILLLFCLPLFGRSQETPATKPLTWYSIEEALILNEKQPRPVMIDLYTDWCGWCKVMDQRTFSNPEIIRVLSTYFYPVKFDAEQKPEVNFKGRIFKFVPSGQRGYHELAAALTQGKLSYPTLVFLDKTMTPLQPLPGYKTPEDLEPIINFFGTGIYLTKTYDEFMKEFKSKL
jgi:thioredoxin-related protein